MNASTGILLCCFGLWKGTAAVCNLVTKAPSCSVLFISSVYVFVKKMMPTQRTVLQIKVAIFYKTVSSISLQIRESESWFKGMRGGHLSGHVIPFRAPIPFVTLFWFGVIFHVPQSQELMTKCFWFFLWFSCECIIGFFNVAEHNV